MESWQKEHQEISLEVEKLEKQVNSAIGSMRLNKNLFFRFEIQSLRERIIRFFENEVKNIPAYPEMLSQFSDVALSLANLENSLPVFNYYYKTPYRVQPADPQVILSHLTMIDTGSSHRSRGVPEDFVYFKNFPIKEYKVLRSGYRLLLIDLIPDFIKDVIKQSREWEPEITALLRKYIRPGSTAIDVGAHIGIHTLSMSLLVGDEGSTIAFEPQLKLYTELIMNLQINECKNVVAYRCALSDAIGIGEIQTPPGNEGGTSLSTGGSQVFVTTLDSLNFVNVSLIKIDAENCEFLVLNGARETIRRCRPVIVLEIMARNEPDRVEKMIEIFKFLIFELKYTMEFVGTFNYVAVPNI